MGSRAAHEPRLPELPSLCREQAAKQGAIQVEEIAHGIFPNTYETYTTTTVHMPRPSQDSYSSHGSFQTLLSVV